MSLDTQTFAITRYWLSVALAEVPRTPDIFGGGQVILARKAFLAGANQLKAIRSWLTNGEIISSAGRQVALTDYGKVMAAKDCQSRKAWTWWMFHLHLCANKDSYPYSTFFTTFDSEGASWLTQEDIIQALYEAAQQAGNPIEKSSIETYFAGVERALRPGSPLYALGLVERRQDSDGAQRLRRRVARPSLLVIAYATLLLHRRYFPAQPTVEMRGLLQKGLGKVVGLRDSEVREALGHISNNADLSPFIQYRQSVNLDSVQFTDSSDSLLWKCALQAYTDGEIRWQ